MLRLLPSGLAGAALPRQSTDSAYTYQVRVANVAGKSCDVLLCGVSHISPSSAAETRAAVEGASSSLAAVALECDAQTLALLRCAHEAIDGLPRERVRSDGVALVRAALFRSPTVQHMAARSGASLDAPSSVGLPPPIVRHLTRDGVLWSDEMREAADVADALGARVVCLGAPAPPSASSPPPPPAPLLGMAACWLRAHALRPGLLNERGCAAADIAAMNTAMQEMLPALYSLKVVEADERMAAGLLAVCKQLRAEEAHEAEAAPSEGARPVRCVVAVVGAQHVPGLASRLQPV